MKKIIFILIISTLYKSSYSQSKSPISPNPISLLDSITTILNYVTFWGGCSIGDARGEAQFDLTTIHNKSPKIGVTYSVLGYKVTETGILKNFRYTNDGPYNTKKLIANWENTQPQHAGSGEFLLTFYGDEKPNTLYIEIRGGASFSPWVYYLNEKLTDNQFNRIKKLMASPSKSVASTTTKGKPASLQIKSGQFIYDYYYTNDAGNRIGPSKIKVIIVKDKIDVYYINHQGLKSERLTSGIIRWDTNFESYYIDDGSVQEEGDVFAPLLIDFNSKQIISTF